MNLNSGRKLRASLAFVSSVVLAAFAVAQDTSSTTASASTTTAGPEVKMEKFLVTGSYLPQSEAVSANPVVTLDAKEFNFSGATDTLDFFRKETPYFMGNGNIGKEVNNGGPNGESYVALRNLTTLVLIDGRRTTASPNSYGTAVDLNTIPSAMIDHVEILKDGASTLYGSDAVGGVVNVITKKNYNGFELSAREGFDHLYDYKTEEYSVVGGYSNATASLTIGFDYFRNTPLKTPDRLLASMEPAALQAAGRLAAPTYMSGTYPGRVGSYVLAGSPQAIGAPGYNASKVTPPAKTDPNAPATTVAALAALGYYVPISTTPRGMLLGATNLNTTLFGTDTIDPTNRKNFMANFDKELAGDKLKFFASFMFSETANVGVVLAPGPTGPGVLDFDNMIIPANNPWNFFGQDITSFGGFTGSIRSRFVDVGLRTLDVNTDTFRLATGFRGDINENFSWELGTVYSHAEYKSVQRNAVNGHAFNAAVTPLIDSTTGKYVYNAKGQPLSALSDAEGNPLPVYNYFALAGFNDPATVDAIRANLFQTGNTDFKSIDFRVTGTPVELPAGKLSVALGVEYRGDAVTNFVDTLYASGYLMGGLNPVSAFNGGKTNTKSVFAEVEVPITAPFQKVPGLYELSMDVSGRDERLDTGAKSDVPKIGFKWQPFNKDISLRGTYAKGFIAPTPYALFGPAQNNSPTVVLPDTTLGGKPNSVQITSTELANPNLAPSKTKGYTGGIVYSPHQIKGLNIGLDYYYIQQDKVGSIDYQTIYNDLQAKGSGSVYAATYRDANGNALTTTTPNQITVQNVGSITVQHNPAGDQKTKGLDVQASYDYNLPDDLGQMRFTTMANFLFSYKFRSTMTSPYLEYARKYTNQDTGLGGQEGTLPGYNIKANLLYSYRNYSAMLTFSYIPPVWDVGDLLGQETDPTAVNDYTTSGKAQRVPKYYTLDAAFSYDFQKVADHGLASIFNGTSISVGANNLFNKGAPFMTSSNEDNTDKQTYDIIGRFFYVQLTKKF